MGGNPKNEEVFQIIPCILKVIQLDNRRFTVMEYFILTALIHVGNIDFLIL